MLDTVLSLTLEPGLDLDLVHVPAGEFIEVMNQLVKAGSVKVFGVSNWTRPRFEQANQYARAKGLAPLSVLSNNLSLAQAAQIANAAGALACTKFGAQPSMPTAGNSSV